MLGNHRTSRWVIYYPNTKGLAYLHISTSSREGGLAQSLKDFQSLASGYESTAIHDKHLH